MLYPAAIVLLTRHFDGDIHTVIHHRVMHCKDVKFDILKAVNIIWDVAPCRLVQFYRRFGGMYCLHIQVKKAGYGRFFLTVDKFFTVLHGVSSQTTVLNMANC
jgi:hypothetical protein